MLKKAPGGGWALSKWLKNVAVVVAGSKKTEGGPVPEVEVSGSRVHVSGKLKKRLDAYLSKRKATEAARKKAGKSYIEL